MLCVIVISVAVGRIFATRVMQPKV